MVLGIFGGFSFHRENNVICDRIFKNQAEKISLILDPDMDPGIGKSGIFQIFQGIIQSIGKDGTYICGKDFCFGGDFSIGSDPDSFFFGQPGFFPADGICNFIPQRDISGTMASTSYRHLI